MNLLFLFSFLLLIVNQHLQASLLRAARCLPRRTAAALNVVRCTNSPISLSMRALSTAPSKVSPAVQAHVAAQFSNTNEKFSLSKYITLTPVGLAAMRVLSQKYLAATDKTKVAHPAFARTDELHEEAETIRNAYPRARIYGVGQGPAYLLEAAAARNALQGKDLPTFDHVAFSGTFHEGYLTARHGDLAFHADPKKLPTAEQREAYRIYLWEMGLSPQQILHRYQNGVKTVIVDNVFSGGTLASFLWMLDCDPALHNELQKALSLRIYPGNGHKRFNYHFPTEVVTDHAAVLKDFGNWYNQDSTRLVPRFYPNQWDVVNPHNHSYHLNTNLALFSIYDRLKSKNNK